MLNWLRNVVKCTFNYIPVPIEHSKLVCGGVWFRLDTVRQFSMLNWLRNVVKCTFNYIPVPIECSKLVCGGVRFRLDTVHISIDSTIYDIRKTC